MYIFMNLGLPQNSHVALDNTNGLHDFSEKILNCASQYKKEQYPKQHSQDDCIKLEHGFLVLTTDNVLTKSKSMRIYAQVHYVARVITSVDCKNHYPYHQQ